MSNGAEFVLPGTLDCGYSTIEHTMKVGAIIAAAGAGRRMKADRPKQFLVLEGLPILVLTLRKFDASPLVDHIVIANKEPHISKTNPCLSASINNISTVTGREARASINDICRPDAVRVPDQ